MSPAPRTRRDLLSGVAVVTVGGLAGCGGVFAEDGTPTPDPYQHVRNEQLYVADALSPSVPGPVETVDEPADADVVILPASTDRDTETAVGWITAGKRIALVGQSAQDTWLAWQDGDAYAAAYPDHRGRARSCSSSSSGGGAGGGSGGSSGDAEDPTDCEPPDLLVGWEPAEGPPTTYRKTWAATDDPDGQRVVSGIDESYEEW